MLPSTETVMHASSSQGDRGGGVRLGLVLGVGRTLEETPSAKDVSKEAETALEFAPGFSKHFILKRNNLRGVQSN